jgi:hypothetical protein
MTMDLEIEDDWEVVDNRETITYERKIGDADSTQYAAAIEVEDCLFRGVTTMQQGGGDSVAVAECRWHLWKDKLPEGVTPGYGDRITRQRDGSVWIAYPQKAFETFETRYRLPCKKYMG